MKEEIAKRPLLTREQFRWFFKKDPIAALFISRPCQKSTSKRFRSYRLRPPSDDPWDLVMTFGRSQTPLGKLLIPLCSHHREAVYAQQASLMEGLHIPNKVILAYQRILLLYVENAAITQVVLKIGDPELRKALPEVLTRTEAVSLMALEHNLTQDDVVLLEEILPNRTPTQRAKDVQATWVQAVKAMEASAYLDYQEYWGQACE